LFPPNYHLVFTGNSFMSVDFTPGNFDAQVRFGQFPYSAGNSNYSHAIHFTNWITYSIFEDNLDEFRLAPSAYVLGIYDYYEGVIKKFQMAWMSEFSFNKFGSPFLMSLSLKWTNFCTGTCPTREYDITREVFDMTQPNGSTSLTANTDYGTTTIVRMIGTVINSNDIKAHLKPQGGYSYTNYYFTFDNDVTLTKYEFTSHAAIGSRSYPSSVFSGTPKYYKSIYDSDYILLALNSGYLVLINIESS